MILCTIQCASYYINIIQEQIDSESVMSNFDSFLAKKSEMIIFIMYCIISHIRPLVYKFKACKC